MQETVLKSKRVVTEDGIRPAAIIIRGEKIIGITDEYEAGKNVVDAGNNLIMPGIIDPHVHINEPGRTHWEGFDTATRAALAGGITTIVDMPLNSSPVTTTVAALKEKMEAASAHLHCNCGFWGGIIPGNQSEIEGLVTSGVLGFKAFLVHSGIDEFPNVNETELRKALHVIAKHKLPVLVHCELARDNHSHQSGKMLHYRDYLQSRPPEWETEAISLVIRLCRETGCPVHIVHLSAAEGIELIRNAKAEGLPVTAETVPHYLYFHAEQIQDGRTEFKCAPPIRSKDNNDRLWNGLIEGVIDFVATDHSPCPPSMKTDAKGDFNKAWGGISSLQFSLPVLWTGALRKGLALHVIPEWLCEKPARFTGLDHRKGFIKTGYDADLVIWDPENTFTVEEEIIYHRHKLTPYRGEQLYGTVEQTWIAGQKDFDSSGSFHPNKGAIILHRNLTP
jgi:allantoinase